MVSGKWRGLVHTPAGRAAAPPSGIKLVSLGMDWWVTTRRWGCGVGLYGGERVCFFLVLLWLDGWYCPRLTPQFICSSPLNTLMITVWIYVFIVEFFYVLTCR